MAIKRIVLSSSNMKVTTYASDRRGKEQLVRFLSGRYDDVKFVLLHAIINQNPEIVCSARMSKRINHDLDRFYRRHGVEFGLKEKAMKDYLAQVAREKANTAIEDANKVIS